MNLNEAAQTALLKQAAERAANASFAQGCTCDELEVATEIVGGVVHALVGHDEGCPMSDHNPQLTTFTPTTS